MPRYLRGQVGKILVLATGILLLYCYSYAASPWRAVSSWLKPRCRLDLVNNSRLGATTETEVLPKPTCPDVLGQMTQGRWISRPLTGLEVTVVQKFLNEVCVHYHMPANLQRADGRCGNVSLIDNPQQFRGLCDADGPTPCCYENVCVNRPVEECTCSNCWDMRNRVHAEYSTWITDNDACTPLDLSIPQICRLLDGATLFFMGDSLARHMYTAVLMMVSGNNQTGAQSPDIPKDRIDYCKGMGMFIDQTCRRLLNDCASVCNGRAAVTFFPSATVAVSGFEPDVEEVMQLLNKPRSLAFISSGIHGGFAFKRTQEGLMEPLIQKLKSLKARWPMVMWGDTHQYGLLKFTDIIYHDQSALRAEKFNTAMKTFFEKHKVPVFSSYNLTARVISFDGVHFGIGINMLKARIFINYILELYSLGLW